MLKSGGPKMTVSSVIGGTVQCLWIGEEGESAMSLIVANALQDATVCFDEEEPEDEPDHEADFEVLDAKQVGGIGTVAAHLLIGRTDKAG
jgi:uncharacterized protein YodC (DUF2158 family)